MKINTRLSHVSSLHTLRRKLTTWQHELELRDLSHTAALTNSSICLACFSQVLWQPKHLAYFSQVFLKRKSGIFQPSDCESTENHGIFQPKSTHEKPPASLKISLTHERPNPRHISCTHEQSLPRKRTTAEADLSYCLLPAKVAQRVL